METRRAKRRLTQVLQSQHIDRPTRDMSAFSFTLTLLLSSTIAAANTDQPLFWLLIGPAPLAVDLAVTIFLRQRFHLDACLLALRKWNVQTENRDRAIGEVSLGCTCRLSR
jgi:hypothetical protein